MKAVLPRRMTLYAIEAAFLTLGYHVSKEPFDVVAFRPLREGRRFHARLETHGLAMVPKGAELDLHVDFIRELRRFHRSEAESGRIANEMDAVLRALESQEPSRGRPRVRCPDCGKEFGHESYPAHRTIVHGR